MEPSAVNLVGSELGGREPLVASLRPLNLLPALEAELSPGLVNCDRGGVGEVE